MSKVGGARPGAGRKRGTPNIKSVEVISKALEHGITPVEYMLETMRDENADPKERQWAAEKSAPFIHPRPSPTPRTVKIDLPEVNTAGCIKRAIAKVAQETALGNLAPSEAHSLVAVFEAQRKAIETTEIIERITKLEEQQVRK